MYVHGCVQAFLDLGKFVWVCMCINKAVDNSYVGSVIIEKISNSIN
jgi:hypothetical protein